MLSDIVNSLNEEQEKANPPKKKAAKKKAAKKKVAKKKATKRKVKEVKDVEIVEEVTAEVITEDSVETHIEETTTQLVPEETTEEPVTPVLQSDGKEELFDKFLSNVDVSDMNLSKSEMEELNKGLTNMQDSDMGLLRNCDSESCQQRNICPFNRIGKFPEGQLCPVEKSIMQYMSNGYYQMLEEELGHSNYNMVEISTIHSLLEVDLEEFRARIYSNSEGMIVQNAAFVDKESGSVIFNNVENPVYNLRERLDRRKAKLLQRLLITPEAKARFKVETKDRGAKTTKDLISSAEAKIRKLKDPSGGKR